MTSSHLYDVHDLVTIDSDINLPELAPFQVATLTGPAKIRVRVGLSRPAAGSDPAHRRITYDEGLGPLGFQCAIDLDETIEVLASPLLRLSPHVLYTNIVEPILRWTFAAGGYTLVHGACLAWGDSAYLISALTDTGKTTTVLQLLGHSRPTDPAAFVSDDLTLLSPSGAILTYPKPLTISAHTLHAIDTGGLDWRHRLFLPWQSMVHSRGGRRTAHRMAHWPLPVATINAITQMLVPPPKYPVEALIPGVRFRRAAQLAGIFFIEWGADADLRLADDDALDRLMRNGEDAYGFPPYNAIAPSLYQSPGGDLRLRERAMVGAALQGVPKRLIRRAEGNWWRVILADISASPQPTASTPEPLDWVGPPASRPPA